jgi:hypothetical protein
MELRVGGGGFFSRRKWNRRWFSITGMFIDVAVKEVRWLAFCCPRFDDQTLVHRWGK